MTTFCLVHGACHGSWCWDGVIRGLQARGHRALAIDLPCEDTSAGLEAYRDVVMDSLREEDDVIIVGHSLGGLVIPLVAESRPVRHLVFLCARIPLPGRTVREPIADAPSPTLPGWKTHENGDGTFSILPEVARTIFYHDCSRPEADWAVSKLRPQARRPIEEASPLKAWPNVERSYILCKEDRVIPADWSRHVARRLLGVTAIELEGGHCPFISRPSRLVEWLAELTA